VASVLHRGAMFQGHLVEEFELACAECCGRELAVAVSSGTAALHCALTGLGLTEGDEVVTTPYAPVALINAILYTRARPVLVDIDPKTLTLAPEKLEAAITPRTRAVLALDVFGHPAGMSEIEQIAGRHEIPLIEDACAGFGARWKSRPVGSFGRASVLSFCDSCVLTTGEGGMVVTDDHRLANVCRSLRDQGRENRAWDIHTRLGFSYRMCEMNAALGLAQFGHFQEILDQRRRLAREYFEALMTSGYVTLPTIEQDTSLSWSSFAVRLNELFEPSDRDEVIRLLRLEGIGCQAHLPALHLQPYLMPLLKTAERDFPVCEYVASRTIALPLWVKMQSADVRRVCTTLHQVCERVLTSRNDRMKQ
jgi:perosamine synthetase